MPDSVFCSRTANLKQGRNEQDSDERRSNADASLPPVPSFGVVAIRTLRQQ